MALIIETEFQTNTITLHFESTKRRERLTKEETREFNERMQRLLKEEAWNPYQ